jgi:hypothetical protein
MSSQTAITIFVLCISFFLFVLPFQIRFSKSLWLNNIFRRALWTIAIYTMMLNSAMVATIAEEGGLPLSSELFRYMWIFGTAGYVFMGYFVLKTLFELIQIFIIGQHKQRMGEDEDEYL